MCVCARVSVRGVRALKFSKDGIYMRLSVNNNSLDCEQLTGLHVNQSPDQCTGCVSANTRPHQLRWSDHATCHAHAIQMAGLTCTCTRVHVPSGHTVHVSCIYTYYRRATSSVWLHIHVPQPIIHHRVLYRIFCQGGR